MKKNSNLDLLITDEIVFKNLGEYIDRKTARIPVSKQLAMIDKSDFLVSSD